MKAFTLPPDSLACRGLQFALLRACRLCAGLRLVWPVPLALNWPRLGRRGRAIFLGPGPYPGGPTSLLTYAAVSDFKPDHQTDQTPFSSRTFSPRTAPDSET